MRIEKITERYGNNFKAIVKCEHCGHEQRRNDCYADHYFCLVIIPEGTFCDECGLNSYGFTLDQQQARYAEFRSTPALTDGKQP